MHRLMTGLEHLAVALALAIPFIVAPALAQTTKPDPGPEEPNMPAMMQAAITFAPTLARMGRT